MGQTWGMERSPSYFPKIAIGMYLWRAENPWVNLFHSPAWSGKRKQKNHREIRKYSPNPAEMTGDSCPGEAAAVDHADTKLIGQTGHRVSLWCLFIGIFSIISTVATWSGEISPASGIYHHWYNLLHVPRFFTVWKSCIGPPSQPKLALSLPIKGPSYCRLTDPEWPVGKKTLLKNRLFKLW